MQTPRIFEYLSGRAARSSGATSLRVMAKTFAHERFVRSSIENRDLVEIHLSHLAFESFRFDWLDVPALIRAVPAIWVYPMVDRDPLPWWTHGPMTLLGDAAHPMYPVGSNGASQAILDARVLTGCMRYYRDDLERGLLRYDERRRPATAKIVLSNRQHGPGIVMQLVEERAPDGFARLEDVITTAELQAIADEYKRLAGFAIEELNARGSLAEPTP